MENSIGFVYVMINASYTGLVKIGKTTKDPDERAKELSSATGVATPFIVVYKRQFNNCHVAEKVVHNILEEQGYRVNYSREFFSISISDAIDIILQIPDDECIETEFDQIGDVDNSESDDLAKSYYKMAEDYFYGHNGKFQDQEKALFYYEKSASLGYGGAYENLGDIWLDKNNSAKAINYYLKAVDRYQSQCYAKLAKIYMDCDSGSYNERNAIMAWTKYFEYLERHKDSLLVKSEYIAFSVGFNLYSYFRNYLLHGEIPAEHESFINTNYTGLIAVFKAFTEMISTYNKPSIIQYVDHTILPYINKLVEKHAVYGLEGNELANKYFLLAKESFKSIENFDNSSNNLEEEQKAFELFSKSSDLGHQISNIYIGVCWLYKGYDYSINHADKAWKSFYNYAYNTFTEQPTTISEEQKEELLEGFTLIIYYAIKFNAEHLIHEYYVLLALYLGIIDYYSKRIDILGAKDCYKIDDSFEFKSFDPDKLDFSNHSDVSDLIDQTKLILDYFESEKERKRIEIVHSYVKDFAVKMKDKFGSQTKFMIYPLDI